jgi:selenide, water dikinase
VSADLLSLCSAGGCSSKLPEPELQRILDVLTGLGHLTSISTATDAAVFDFQGSQAIFSVDFGTPVSNDPFQWGAIAAQNAISDIFAVGGSPLTALSVLCWPRSLPIAGAEEVLRGAAHICTENETLILGGHSLALEVPIFGLAVFGNRSAEHGLRLDGCQPGDLIALSKPLGSGLAIGLKKAGLVSDSAWNEAVAVMLKSNRSIARSAISAGIEVATDVTGFGLIGHLRNILVKSEVSAKLESRAIPQLSVVAEAVEHGLFTNLGESQMFQSEQFCKYETLDFGMRHLLNDPQTSGGLLLVGSSAPLKELAKSEQLTIIGEIISGDAKIEFF